MAECLVRWGQLRVGDPVVVGSCFGHVKAMVDDKGKSLKSAGPSTAIRLLGLKEIPVAGQELLSLETDEEARKIVQRRVKVAELRKSRQNDAPSNIEDSSVYTVKAIVPGSTPSSAKQSAVVISAVDTVGVGGHLTAEQVALKMIEEKGGIIDAEALAAELAIRNASLNVIIKADGVGTLEALRHIVQGLNQRTSDARIRIVNAAVGPILKTDVELLSTAVNAKIFGFNIGFADVSLKNFAKRSDVDVVTDTVIYRLEDEMIANMQKLMPTQRKLISQVRIFSLSVVHICDDFVGRWKDT